MYQIKNLNSILLIAVIVFSIALISCAQDEGRKNHNNDMQKSDAVKVDSSIVREGVIDLAVIDENTDGKVYQDQMCWNVVSDKPGECPLCGMTLKEVSLQKAEENLLKHNFKVKEN